MYLHFMRPSRLTKPRITQPPLLVRSRERAARLPGVVVQLEQGLHIGGNAPGLEAAILPPARSCPALPQEVLLLLAIDR